MPIGQENTRFRSFAERYIIERASSFETGKEDAGIWKALQDAKRAYSMIERSAHAVEKTMQEAMEHEYRNALQVGNASNNNIAPGQLIPVARPIISGPPSLSKTVQEQALKALADPNTPPTIKERVRKFLQGGPIV